MSKSADTEAQIIGAVKQVESGRKVEEVAREVGVSKHTIYAWKQKYGGLEVAEAQELRHLREENAKLKKLVAEYALDKEASARAKDRDLALCAGCKAETLGLLHGLHYIGNSNPDGNQLSRGIGMNLAR
jgi:putative transposase